MTNDLVANYPGLSWYQHAREWQPLLGAVLGFGGVMLTLFANAWLARRADQRRNAANRADDQRKRHDEAEALRVALLEEYKSFLGGIGRRIEAAKKNCEAARTVQASLPGPLLVTAASIPKITLLHRDQIRAVLNTFGIRMHLVNHMYTMIDQAASVAVSGYDPERVLVPLRPGVWHDLIKHLQQVEGSAGRCVEALKCPVTG